MQWWLVLENCIKLFTTVIGQLRKKAWVFKKVFINI